ncbi:gliding motility-associated C-terminal domain-containing protein [bacterium]|nr:gliding motility-associated C-terminal domain-containing protein [bacterium]
MIDTAYISFKYEYCPDGKADLEIKGQENIVTIKDVALVGVSGGFSSMFSTTDTKNHQWTCVSVDAIKTSLLDKYSPLRIKVTYEVKDGNCQFTLVREEVVNLKQRNDCNMDFELVSIKDAEMCIGVSRNFRLVNADNNVVADSVVVEPHPVFTFKQTSDKMGIEPYYAGAATIFNQTGNITATIYFHMQGSAQPISMTKDFKLNVNSCKPEFGGKVEINNNETVRCPMCPGAVFTGTIRFTNPTTAQDRCKVDFVSTSETRADSKRNKWNGNLPQFVVYQYLFGDMDYRLKVTYNEGDSVYVIDNLAFANSNITLGGARNVGESATNTSIKLADICSLKTDVKPGDSVCAGEWLDLYVYSENLFEELQTIEWENKNIKPASGTDAVGREDWEYTFRYGTNLGTTGKKTIKRFHYQVQAEGSGIYAFKLQSKIRESVFERKDTIRVAILAKPRIFIQDTVYTCENSGLDLWKYVDSAAVDVKTCTAPGGLVISKATDKDFRVATATLRYNCTNTTWSERITIRTDAEVYNAFIPDAEYCPGETVTLNAKTNGRVTWTRRQLLDGGGLSQADTLVADGENKILSDQMGESSQLYTVTARTGCNKPPFQTVQFWANAKPVPEVNIIDNSACRPEPLVLQTAPFDAAEVDSAKDVKWYVNGAAYALPTVPPADKVTVRCEVTGKNGCGNSAEITMHSYDAPTIKIGIQGNPGFTGKIYCATQNEAIHFTARGADSYAWSSKAGATASSASEYIFNVLTDDVLYLVGAESQKGCQTKDSVSIVLKPKAEVQSDTIACLGEMIYIEPVGEADVNLSLTDPAGAQCSCAWIYVPNYLPEDTGIYVFKFNRNGCEESREVHLRMYPIPAFDFTETEFCEDDNLKLDVNTGLTSDWLRQSRFIWSKEGTELQNKVGNSAYTGGKLALSDAGDYELEIQVNRCINNATVNVRVDAHSHPAFPVDSFYCEGSDFVTDAENQGEGATYEWYSVNRPHMGTSAITKLELGELEMADSAYLKLTVYRGACVDDTSIFIHVRSMPHPQLQAAGSQQDEKGVFYCAGTPLRLDVPDARGEDLMEWYHDGERIEGADLGSYGVSSADLEDGGKYMFKVERNGCYGETSLYVDVRPLPVPLVGDTFMCSGHVFILDASNEDFPGATFRWTPLGTTGAEAEIHTGGQYSVAMMYDGCEGSQSFVVEERPSPRIGFPSDTVMCQRDSILLEGPGAMETYRWQDGTSGQSYLVNTEGLYSLYVELMGCSDYNEVFVHEDFCSNLYFPSAFTPNGDGNNDSFGPVTTAVDDQVVYSLYIYNRNGEKVFESHRMTEVWDGNYKGAKCPAGVYIYRCKAHAKQNGRNLSADGTVTLLR